MGNRCNRYIPLHDRSRESIDDFVRLEKSMLSPHELATLMLVKDAPEQIVDRAELSTLLERRLIALVQPEEDVGLPRPRITENGNSILEAFSRLR